MTTAYSPTEPDLAQIDAEAGPLVLDFGTNWCGHCRAAQPIVDQALALRPDVRHIRVEDGSGRRLGRTFGVKLWPTLVFLEGGVEVARLVRPPDAAAIGQALAKVHGRAD